MMKPLNPHRRYDQAGRDVTDLPGLWDESDVFRPIAGTCENCERLRQELEYIASLDDGSQANSSISTSYLASRAKAALNY